MSNLNVFDSVVLRLPRYLAGLSGLIDIRQIKSIVIAYSDRKRISPRPANLAAFNADGDIRLRLGGLQPVDQRRGSILAMSTCWLLRMDDNAVRIIEASSGGEMGPFAVNQGHSPQLVANEKKHVWRQHLSAQFHSAAINPAREWFA
jgi:hypothetical protein